LLHDERATLFIPDPLNLHFIIEMRPPHFSVQILSRLTERRFLIFVIRELAGSFLGQQTGMERFSWKESFAEFRVTQPAILIFVKSFHECIYVLRRATQAQLIDKLLEVEFADCALAAGVQNSESIN
jgi:hypothetical protein